MSQSSGSGNSTKSHPSIPPTAAPSQDQTADEWIPHKPLEPCLAHTPSETIEPRRKAEKRADEKIEKDKHEENIEKIATVRERNKHQSS